MEVVGGRRRGRPPAANTVMSRQSILDAAREVFSEVGYEAAKLQTIAKRSGLTTPSIVHHFRSKPALFRAATEQTTAAVIGSAVSKAQQTKPTLPIRLSAFFAAAINSDSADRSTAAFLVTSVLEAHRRPDLVPDEHDALKSSRQFVTSAVNDAVERGELHSNTEIPAIVEMLIAAMWGIGFYAGYVGNTDELGDVVDKFELLIAHRLWQVADTDTRRESTADQQQ
jgi:AcrR family transcriptional regulator